MHCAKCGTLARKIHRPFWLRLLPLGHLYYCWPCHKRFLAGAPAPQQTRLLPR